MANFNVNFGQNVISNAQKNRQLALEKERIDNAREAAAASAANQASATFWSRVNAEEQNANRKKELELREEKQDKDLSWEDAVKEQELAEREARTDMLRKQSAKYDMAYEADQAKADEEVAQAKERANLLNSELGTLYLSAYKRGGRVSPSQIAAFNETTGSQYDFIGNTMTFQSQDGATHTETIGDGKSFYMGQYQRDAQGKIVYGQDGTPMTQMVEMPRQMQRALISSAYGKEYIGAEKTSGSGLSLDDRIALEEAKTAGRMEVEGLKQKGASERAAGNNATKKEVAGMQTASREKIAAGHDQTRLELADISAALKKQGFEVDEAKLAEAIRHNKATEAATAGRDAETGRHHKATEDAATARTEERTRHNKATEEVQQQRADTQAQRVEDQYELGDRKQTHNENRLENDKAQKEADRQLKRELADLRARTRRAESRSTSTPSRIKEINSELTALEKIIANGKPEDRKNAKARMSALSDELSGNGGDKATIKSGDNTHDEGTQEPPNGEYHTVKDGVSYHWGKSKSGKYGYFPDK